MFGKILGAAIRVVTLPVDAVNITTDIITGGTGSKHSRTSDYNPLGRLEKIRDKVAEAAENIDER